LRLLEKFLEENRKKTKTIDSRGFSDLQPETVFPVIRKQLVSAHFLSREKKGLIWDKFFP
jgi:hypothetical protein